MTRLEFMKKLEEIAEPIPLAEIEQQRAQALEIREHDQVLGDLLLEAVDRIVASTNRAKQLLEDFEKEARINRTFHLATCRP